MRVGLIPSLAAFLFPFLFRDLSTGAPPNVACALTLFTLSRTYTLSTRSRRSQATPPKRLFEPSQRCCRSFRQLPSHRTTRPRPHPHPRDLRRTQDTLPHTSTPTRTRTLLRPPPAARRWPRHRTPAPLHRRHHNRTEHHFPRPHFPTTCSTSPSSTAIPGHPLPALMHHKRLRLSASAATRSTHTMPAWSRRRKFLARACSHRARQLALGCHLTNP